MATKLSASDLSAVVECLRELHSHTDSQSLPLRMLQLLRQIVPANLLGFTEVDPVLGQSSGCLYPPPKWPIAEIAQRFQESIGEHPVVQYAQRTRDGQSKAISDFLSAKEFHATRLYKTVYKRLKAEDQLSIGMVGSAGLMIGLSFNRARRGFSQRDRDILNLLRPHLIQAYLNCRELEQRRNADDNRRGAVIDQLPLGLICVDSRGRIVWCTDPARSMLLKHFPDDADSIHGLPHPLRLWLKSAASSAAKDSSAQQLSAQRPGFELRIRLCPLKDNQAILLMQEPPLSAAQPALSQYGLTGREEQVMQCILSGSEIPQVAQRLSISLRTVQKHLERIFHKLGVKSRSAACLKVLNSGAG